MDIQNFLDKLKTTYHSNRNSRYIFLMGTEYESESVAGIIFIVANEKIYMSRLLRNVLRNGIYHEVEETWEYLSKRQQRLILFNLDLFA